MQTAMSDIHPLPLVGHDLDREPLIRATVFKQGPDWYWSYEIGVLVHGPFSTWTEAYTSARHTVEEL